MKKRHELARGFREIAVLINQTCSPGMDIRAAILGNLTSLGLLEHRQNESDALDTMLYNRMQDAFVLAVEAMRHRGGAAAMLAAFEEAVHTQSAYDANRIMDLQEQKGPR